MGIKKRDRSFENIVREINIDVMPVDYIDELTLILADNTRVTFDGDDLNKIENVLQFIKMVAAELEEEHGEEVEKVEIGINYSALENDVNEKVKKLLNKDDSSNTSM
jgi:hypothetical protein